MTWLKANSSDLVLIRFDSILSIDVTHQKADDLDQIQVAAYALAGNGQFVRYLLATFSADTDKQKIEKALEKMLIDIRLCVLEHVLTVQKTLTRYLSHGLSD